MKCTAYASGEHIYYENCDCACGHRKRRTSNEWDNVRRYDKKRGEWRWPYESPGAWEEWVGEG